MSPVTRLQNRKALESLKALFDICPVCHEKLCPDKLFILHNHHAICINCKNSWLEQLNMHATTNTEGVVKCPSCRKSCHLQIPDIANIKLQQLLRMLPMGNRHRSNLDQRIWGQRYRFPPMEFLWVRIHWKIHWMMSPYMIDIVRSE